MGEMILRAIKGSEGTWEPTRRVIQLGRLRQPRDFVPPSSVLFFFSPSFSSHQWVFCFRVHGAEGRSTKRQQEGKQKMLRPQNKSLRLQFREYWGGMGLEGVQGSMGTRSASMAGTHPIPFWTPSWPRWQSWANHNG